MNRSILLWVFVGFVLGNVTGFFAGILSFKAGRTLFEDMFTVERPADVANPKKLNRRTLSLEYPGNWKIAKTDEDFDPDHNFTIESLGSSMLGVLVYEPPITAEDAVGNLVDYYETGLFKGASKSSFTNWGSHEGHGVHLKGRVFSLMSGGVRIFSTATEKQTLLVYEFYYDDEMRNVEPGFELIRKSFVLKE